MTPRVPDRPICRPRFIRRLNVGNRSRQPPPTDNIVFPAPPCWQPVVWCGGRPLTPDDRPISGRVPASARAPNLYLHSGGGAYGWRVSMGVSQQLAATIAEDGHLPADLPPPLPDGGLPSLDGAAPQTSFDPEVVDVQRFPQLPLWPRALFGW